MRIVHLFALCLACASAVSAQTRIPLTADRWIASDSVRFEPFLGRPSLYMNRGVVLARDVSMTDGVIEYDMASTTRTNFMGAVFHATSPENSEVVFFRVGASGTSEAVQYGPALNSLGAAWQVYHGDGANAVASFERERWYHVKMLIAGSTVSVYLDSASQPTLVVPRLAGVEGRGIGLWTGLFGRGAYFSNVQFTPAPRAVAATAPAPFPRGTIVDWQLSDVLDASAVTPGVAPDLAKLTWTPVRAEAPGIVLINRYRRAPAGRVPADVDSIMSGRGATSKVVFARTTIESTRDEFRRMQFSYSDGAVIYVNGAPLFFGMNAQGLRDGLGVMAMNGDAVYLPLKKGRNEIVFAVMEYSGGWAVGARLDP